MQTSIRYVGDCTESGYGYAARGNLHALAQLGWDRHHVRVLPAVLWGGGMGDAPDGDWLKTTYLDAYEDRPDPEHGINLVHVHPCWLSRFWAAGWYNVAITAWETLSLPKSTYSGAAVTRDRTVVETLNECYDEVWVPTEAVAAVFRSSGVTKPIFVMPHALLPELTARAPKDAHPVIPKLHPKMTGEPGQPLRLYNVGTWDARKDQVALLQAYYAAGWYIHHPVELLMHTPLRGNEQQHDVSCIREVTPDWADLPSFACSAGRKSLRWMIDLHEGRHVYATATHGEGFCLPAVEALAMGNLVVGPAGPLAHLDWAALAGYAILLPTHEEDIAVMPLHAGYELGQRWYSVTRADLVKGLQQALDIAQNGCLPLREGAEEARRRYSVTNLAGLIKPRLEEAQRALAARTW